jgi:hypothetical protein
MSIDRATVALLLSIVSVGIATASFLTNYLRGKRQLTIIRAARGLWSSRDEKDHFLIAVTNTGATKETITACGVRDASTEFRWDNDQLPLDVNESVTLQIPIDSLRQRWAEDLGKAAVVFIETASRQKFTSPLAPTALLDAWTLAMREAQKQQELTKAKG